MRITTGSDHASVCLKAALAGWLFGQGHEVDDLGADGEASVDYPEFGDRLAPHVAAANTEWGAALCGAGLGISTAVNRHARARCALVSEPLPAWLSREHNDANVIAMGARMIGIEMAKALPHRFPDDAVWRRSACAAGGQARANARLTEGSA